MSVSSETLDIQAYVNEIIAPQTPPQEAREVFGDYVERLELPISDRFKYIRPQHFVRGEHILPLIANPHDAVVTEMDSLRELSQARTLRGVAAGTQYFDLFITRDETQQGVDATYRLVDTPRRANPIITIETQLQGQLDEPCIFRIANGALQVIERRRWHRGGWQEVRRDVHEESQGEKLLLGLISSTLWAGHLALHRTAEERQEADAKARQLAYTKL